jgi:hypothetical protein
VAEPWWGAGVRIVQTSNFDEPYDENFLGVTHSNKMKLQEICDLLNKLDPAGSYYYKVVDNSYQLRKFEDGK